MLGVCPDHEPPRPKIEALVITYDGLLEPMGNSQVLPYIESLAGDGVRVRVLSFEKPSDLDDAASVERLRGRLDPAGIEWTAVRYHRRRVSGTIVDILQGAVAAIRMARARPFQIVHARSYVAGLIGCGLKFFYDVRFVFDMRGFWPEERVEMGLFRPQGLLYRTSKWCERFLLANSDHIVVLTESAKAILRDREANARLQARGRSVRESLITVIPCCTDLDRFRPTSENRELSAELGFGDKLVIGNIGAVSKRYMLPEMFRFAFHVKSHRPDVQFVYLTRQDGTPVRAAARDAGLRDEDVLVLAVEPQDVPRWLSMFRLGVFFLRPSYAAKGSSYTKLAEFLACGVPVVTNTGVGDVDKILGAQNCGVLVPGLTETDLSAAARQALTLLEGEAVPEDVRERCRATAEKYFALEEGARRFLSIYRSLTPSNDGTQRESVPVGVG